MKTLIFVLILIGVIVYLVSKNWKRVVQIVVGWGLYELLNVAYDYVVWPLVQNHYGVIGAILMSIGAFIINFMILKWYQKKGVNWLGTDILEEIKEKGNGWAERLCNHRMWFVKMVLYVPARFFQFVVWLLNKNDILAFLFLSGWKDSFVTTAFLRHGRFGKLEKRDYTVFVMSTAISCLLWSSVVAIAVEAIKAIF